MSSTPIHQHFERLNLNATAEWIDACFDWARTELGIADQPNLTKACFDQWLAVDLRSEGVQREPVARNQFPLADMSSQLKTTLPAGFYTVQVNSAHDVGLSAYSQLQKLNKVKDENSRVSADADTQRIHAAAWEPKPNRMLRLSLTNGLQTVSAIEHQALAQISDPVPPGLKLTLIGPIVCRRGLLLLTSKNLKVLGGLVDEMQEEFSASNQLSARLDHGSTPSQLLPTQQYTPRGRPPRYRQSCPTTKAPFSKRTLNSQVCCSQNVSSDVFNDTDDALFASIDIPAASDNLLENVFDDEEDDLFSQIELESPKLTNTKRRRL